MLFGKLLPREGNFFELFNQHAGFIAELAVTPRRGKMSSVRTRSASIRGRREQRSS